LNEAYKPLLEKRKQVETIFGYLKTRMVLQNACSSQYQTNNITTERLLLRCPRPGDGTAAIQINGYSQNV